jgi:hypothetical protein
MKIIHYKLDKAIKNNDTRGVKRYLRKNSLCIEQANIALIKSIENININPSIIECLLKAGSNPNLNNFYEMTENKTKMIYLPHKLSPLLHLSGQKSNNATSLINSLESFTSEALIKILLKYGADITYSNVHWTSLLLADYGKAQQNVRIITKVIVIVPFISKRNRKAPYNIIRESINYF